MKLLIAGVLVFTFLHGLPVGAAGVRGRMAAAMGENAWKGIFAFLIAASIGLMIAGWKSTGEVEIYTAPAWGGVVAFICMLAMSVMFFAPYMPNNFSRVIRHPQLAGVVLFGIGHLAAVGNLRSIVLFGGFALWAVIEAVLLNRRDGAWKKPDKVSRVGDLKLILAGLGFFLLFLFTHGALFDASLLTWAGELG